MSELKDCPFCGYKASFHSDIPKFHGFGYGVGCSNPDCVAYSGYGMAVFDTREDAVYAWNMRAKDAIVRCRDCESFHRWDVSAIYGNHEHDRFFCSRFIDGMRMEVEPDGFCKWGKAKGEQR